jgi:hypothetical protein
MLKLNVGEFQVGHYDFEVHPIKRGVGEEMVKDLHYAKSIQSATVQYGLFYGEDLWGVCAFSNQSSIAAQLFYFDIDETVKQIPRSRLLEWCNYVIDYRGHKVPHLENKRVPCEELTDYELAQYMLSNAVFDLFVKHRPYTRIIVSFADPTQSRGKRKHKGTIYEALGFIFAGYSEGTYYYEGPEGQRRHLRQSGRNITRREARARGWTVGKSEPKKRFFKVVGRTKRDRKMFIRLLKEPFREAVLEQLKSGKPKKEEREENPMDDFMWFYRVWFEEEYEGLYFLTKKEAMQEVTRRLRVGHPDEVARLSKVGVRKPIRKKQVLWLLNGQGASNEVSLFDFYLDDDGKIVSEELEEY